MTGNVDYYDFVDSMDEKDLRFFCRQSYVYNMSLQGERARYEVMLKTLYERWQEGNMTEKDWEPLKYMFRFFVKQEEN